MFKRKHKHMQSIILTRYQKKNQASTSNEIESSIHIDKTENTRKTLNSF